MKAVWTNRETFELVTASGTADTSDTADSNGLHHIPCHADAVGNARA
jgi:hypothetical protein